MSWPVEILPQPIEATLMRLLGAFFPNTEAGTIVGKFKAIPVPIDAFADCVKNFLRVIEVFCSCFIAEILLTVSYWNVNNSCPNNIRRIRGHRKSHSHNWFPIFIRINSYHSYAFLKLIFFAFFWAFNASSVARKQCFCDIAVSVRLRTSSTNNLP